MQCWYKSADIQSNSTGAFHCLYHPLVHVCRFSVDYTSRGQQVIVFMSESFESFTTKFFKKHWFILRRSKWLFVWVSHWIIHPNDSDLFGNATRLLCMQKQLKQLTIYLVPTYCLQLIAYYLFFCHPISHRTGIYLIYSQVEYTLFDPLNGCIAIFKLVKGCCCAGAYSSPSNFKNAEKGAKTS